MSKVLKQFEEVFFKEKFYQKLFQKQTPGKRIAPPQAKDNDAKFQLRMDAGEAQNGVKKVYLQVNSQAKNDALKKFKQKQGTHGNLAVGTVDENTSPDDQEDTAKSIWENMSGQAKQNLS